MITFRKFEVNELCRFFLGPVWQRGYEISVFAYLFGCLWGFTSNFGTSAASIIPLLHTNGTWYVCCKEEPNNPDRPS